MISALEIFEREDVSSLPFEPSAAARRAGIRLVTYRSFARTAGCDDALIRRMHSQDGFVLFGGSAPVILYNDQIGSLGRQRWTLTHELCHIWLDRRGGDRAADRLTADLLCPLAVLHLCAVTEPAQIAALCGVSTQAALHRFSDLTALRRSGKILQSEEQLRMAHRFLPFVGRVLCERAEAELLRARYRRVSIAGRG
jgi:Zn-dependent peptidase ImmA (M78 family)